MLIASFSSIYVIAQSDNDRGFAWESANYDIRQTNYNPQNQITRDTIVYLADEWTNAFIIPPDIPGIELSMGMRARPLVYNGIVMMPTNFDTIFAHNVQTGLPLWYYAYPMNMTAIIEEFPAISPYKPGVIEEATVFEGYLIFPTADCGMVFLEYLTGTPDFRGELTRGQMCDNIEGNGGYYTGQLYSSPVVDPKSRVLITGTTVSGKSESGRGYVAGYNVDNGELIWRFYLMPPAGGEQNWAMKYNGLGNVDPTPDDWGTATNVGVGLATGQWAIASEAGIVYVGTSSPAPNFNAVNRPGPNLFSSSILALDINTGDLIWYYQASSHDLNGHGCSWNTTLGNIDDKKVLVTACDDGRLLALDASNGELIWSFLPPNLKYVNVDSSVDPDVDLDKKWIQDPSLDGYWQCPGITGASGGSIAIAYGQVYYMTTNYCDYLLLEPDSENNLDSFGAEIDTKLPWKVPPYRNESGVFEDPNLLKKYMPINATLFAVNIEDGSSNWEFNMPENLTHTGGLIATGDMIIFGSLDGSIYAIDQETGEQVFRKTIGASLGTTPTIAAAASGEQHLFLPVGGLDTRYGQPVSGVFVTSKIRGGPLVPIDSNAHEETIEDADLPLNIAVPVIVLIILVFLLASFGPKRIFSLIQK